MPRFLPILLLVLISTGCGVAFKETFEGTETFKAISLAGDRNVDAPLTLTVTIAQTYPVPVRIACFYEDSDDLTDDDYRVAFQERALRIGDTVLPPGSLPAKKELLSFDFSVPEPGNYFVACLTTASPDNGLGLSFTIRDPDEDAGAKTP